MSDESRGSLGRILLLVGQLVLAAVFLFAAYAKMKPQIAAPWSVSSVKTSLSMFAMQVDSYQLLPESSVFIVAQLLPPFELALGLWLLSGVALRASSIVATLLLGGFFVVMLRTFAIGLEISCGCFGPGEKLGPWTLLRDGSLLAVAVAVAIGAFLVRRRRGEASIPASAPASQRAN